MATRQSTDHEDVWRHEPAALEPPSSVVDAADRPIAYRAYDPGRRASLVEMYDDFAPADRAQGLPPVERDGIETWLDAVLDDASVLAVHDDRVVGHAMFVADDADAHELGVFVHHDYQGAGVGTNLLRAAFAHARRYDIADVWLTVAPWNRRARSVYDRLGFDEDATTDHAVRMTKTL